MLSNIISNPFNLNFNANETVTLNTGGAVFRTNILNLPGRGGFDLILDLVYDSTKADIRRPSTNGFGNITETRHSLHGLGVGWNYDLPYIIENVLYLPQKGLFVLEDNNFRDHTVSDMQLFNDTTFTSGTMRSTRRLTFHGGISYFFSNQHVIGMTDRFSNTIRFEYASTSQIGWHPSRIVDTNGRVVTFQYQSSGSNRTATITGPNSARYTINMSTIPSHNDQQINSVQNQVGATTRFTYNATLFRFCTSSKTPSATSHALLLSEVTYPSGGSLRYDYTTTQANLGRSGSRNIFKVSARFLMEHRNTNSWQTVLHTRFTYNGDATAFPQMVERPPANHTYSVAVAQSNISTTYTFNNRHSNINQRLSTPEGLQSEKAITYNNDNLPTRINLTEHRNGRTRQTQETFTYNRYGQVIDHTTPTGLRTQYTYDNRYGLPLTKAAHNIREVTALSPDRRTTIRSQVYENNTRMTRTDLFYDTHGNITRIKEFPNSADADFISTEISYSSGTRPSTIQTTGIRDADNNLLNGTGVVTTSYLYDNMWQTLSETNANGEATQWQYDSIGRIIRKVAPNTGFETFTYVDSQSTLTHRTVLGGQYIYRYDMLGNLLTVTDPSNNVIKTNLYDSRRRIIETRNTQGETSSQRITFTYDLFDRETNRRYLSPAGETISRKSTSYNDVMDTSGNARITSTIHSESTQSTTPSIESYTQYDRFGRKTQEGVIGGKTITYTHDILDRVIREQTLGTDNSFTYNIFGITSQRNIEGNISRNFYDSMGRVVCSSDKTGNFSQARYDALGRLIRRDVPFERIASSTHSAAAKYYYDRAGNLTRTDTLTSRPGHPQVWSSIINSYQHNQLTSTRVGGTGTNGLTTSYTYNPAGNVLTKNAGGALTTYTYNNQGQLLSETDATGQAETYTYDRNGLLLTKNTRNGTRITNRYNHMGLLSEESTWSGTSNMGRRTYAYTATGTPLCAIATGNGSPTHMINYLYDAQGRLRQQTETGGVVKTYTYNQANNPTEARVFINGVQQQHNRYAYDQSQRLSCVIGSGSPTIFNYDAHGNRIRETQNGTAQTTYTYNLANLITRVTNTTSRFDYTYYLDGNIQSVNDTRANATRSSTYTYDPARRLIRETDTSTIPQAPSMSMTYSFDARGNRTALTATGSENYHIGYTYDQLNRLLTETRTGTEAGHITYAHDRNGNQTQKTTNSQTETRTYNALNQLTNLTNPSTTATYTHRADGLRHAKTVNGILTTYIWDGNHTVLERNANGTITNRYERTPGGQLITSTTQGNPRHNARGDIVQMLNNNQQVQENYHYSAFGGERSNNATNSTTNNTTNNKYLFNGEYFDVEKGEYYLRARSYCPRVGRFTQPDAFWNVGNMQESTAAIMQSGNKYVYTMNNPVMFTDPSGLFVRDLFSMTPGQLRDAGISFGTTGNRDTGVSVSSVTIGNTTVRRDGSYSTHGSGFSGGGVVSGADRASQIFQSAVNVVMGGATERAFFGSSNVMGSPFQHAAVIVKITKGSDYWNDDRFQRSILGGYIRYAAFGGQPQFTPIFEDGITGFGYLRGHINHYLDIQIAANRSSLVPLNADTDQISLFIAAQQHFITYSGESINYRLFPRNETAGRNSNSYIYSLLLHSGICRPSTSGTFPGWGNIIQENHFGIWRFPEVRRNIA